MIKCRLLTFAVSRFLYIIIHSWGQYWGEMGYFRILMGHNSLGIESEIAWATPGIYTVANFPCDEDGGNCGSGLGAEHYVDPSKNVQAVQKRLRSVVE